MRISVEIDQKTLKLLKSLTGERKKSPAISKAIKELLRLKKLEGFAGRIKSGYYNFPLSNSQIEDMDHNEGPC